MMSRFAISLWLTCGASCWINSRVGDNLRHIDALYNIIVMFQWDDRLTSASHDKDFKNLYSLIFSLLIWLIKKTKSDSADFYFID